MIVDAKDLFDEAIELTKEAVDIAIASKVASEIRPGDIAVIGEAVQNLPGGVVNGVAEKFVVTGQPVEIVTTTTEPVTSPDNPPVIVTTTQESADELQRLREEATAEYEERLKEARDVYTDASIVVMEITKDLKDAKRKMKDALEEFFNLQISGPQLPTSVPSLAGSPAKKSKKADAPGTAELPKDLEALIEADTTWRDIPIAEVLSGISGLGSKKHEAIADMYANLGQLEDARGQASREFKTFQEFLPERIGPTMADKIQERCFDVMKSHWAKLRSKIAVANKPEPAREESTKTAKGATAPEPEPQPQQQGVVVSVDDALLDDSDLI